MNDWWDCPVCSGNGCDYCDEDGGFSHRPRSPYYDPDDYSGYFGPLASLGFSKPVLSCAKKAAPLMKSPYFLPILGLVVAVGSIAGFFYCNSKKEEAEKRRNSLEEVASLIKDDFGNRLWKFVMSDWSDDKERQEIVAEMKIRRFDKRICLPYSFYRVISEGNSWSSNNQEKAREIMGNVRAFLIEKKKRGY